MTTFPPKSPPATKSSQRLGNAVGDISKEVYTNDYAAYSSLRKLAARWKLQGQHSRTQFDANYSRRALVPATPLQPPTVTASQSAAINLAHSHHSCKPAALRKRRRAQRILSVMGSAGNLSTCSKEKRGRVSLSRQCDSADIHTREGG